ncbi:MAG: hypothetical protein ACLPID_03445 [Beijerinckiaceae bacterium]
MQQAAGFHIEAEADDRASRLSPVEAGKALMFTPVGEPSGKSRLDRMALIPLTVCGKKLRAT